MFSTLPTTNLNFSVTFILLPANSFSFDQSIRLSFTCIQWNYFLSYDHVTKMSRAAGLLFEPTTKIEWEWYVVQESVWKHHWVVISCNSHHFFIDRCCDLALGHNRFLTVYLLVSLYFLRTYNVLVKFSEFLLECACTWFTRHNSADYVATLPNLICRPIRILPFWTEYIVILNMESSAPKIDRSDMNSHFEIISPSMVSPEELIEHVNNWMNKLFVKTEMYLNRFRQNFWHVFSFLVDHYNVQNRKSAYIRRRNVRCRYSRGFVRPELCSPTNLKKHSFCSPNFSILIKHLTLKQLVTDQTIQFSQSEVMLLSNLQNLCENDWLIDYFRLFIIATGCQSERRPQKTVSCYGR